MAQEIVNRVANSKLVTIDLEDFYPSGERVLFDVKPWLFAEQVLKETDFRAFVKNHDWSQYQNKFVALTCSSDAIIPSWAYLLITTNLANLTKKTVVGDLELLESIIFQDIISQLPLEDYKDKPIIIKGCADKPIPPTAYTLLISRLMPVCKSIMYGEACSNVPLFKSKNK